MIEFTFYADFICPFCYVAEQALLPAFLADRGQLELTLVWQGFELHPNTPLAGKTMRKQDAGRIWGGYKRLLNEWDLPVAKKAPAAIPNTHLTLKAAEAARAQGKLSAFRTAAYRAFWVDGRDIGRAEVLRSLIPGLDLTGLNRETAALATPTEVSAVPAFRIGDRVLHGLHDNDALERFFTAG